MATFYRRRMRVTDFRLRRGEVIQQRSSEGRSCSTSLVWAFMVAAVIFNAPLAVAQTTYQAGSTASPYNVGGTGTFAWSSASWTPSVPGSSAGDTAAMVIQAGSITSGVVNWTLGGPLTLKAFSYTQANAYDVRIGTDASKQTITFDSGAAGVPATLDTSRTGSLTMLRFFLDANAVLNSDLSVTHTRMQMGNSTSFPRAGLTGVISGTGKLTINFVSPATPVGATVLYDFGSTGGSANTYSGGTQLNSFNTQLVFRAMKSNAFGTGLLTTSTATVNMNGFAQTVGGLAGGAGTSTITNTGTVKTLTLTFDATKGPYTFAGAITGGTSTALTKSGAGTQILTGSSNYAGVTTISGGILHVGSAGSINSTSGVTVNGAGAEFKYNSATALSQPLTLTEGILSGTGTIGSAVSVGSNATLSPGNSPGTQPFSAGLTWLAGGTYDWEINDATGTKGADPGWDLIDVTGGTLNLASLTSSAKFNLDLITLNGLTSGSMANYTPGQQYTWQIVRTLANGVVTSSGTAAAGTDLTSLFDLVTTSWASGPVPSTVQVKVSADGAGLDLVVVPEPATLALAAAGGAVAVGGALRRYRRRRT